MDMASFIECRIIEWLNFQGSTEFIFDWYNEKKRSKYWKCSQNMDEAGAILGGWMVEEQRVTLLICEKTNKCEN